MDDNQQMENLDSSGQVPGDSPNLGQSPPPSSPPPGGDKPVTPLAGPTTPPVQPPQSPPTTDTPNSVKTDTPLVSTQTPGVPDEKDENQEILKKLETIKQIQQEDPPFLKREEEKEPPVPEAKPVAEASPVQEEVVEEATPPIKEMPMAQVTTEQVVSGQPPTVAAPEPTSSISGVVTSTPSPEPKTTPDPASPTDPTPAAQGTEVTNQQFVEKLDLDPAAKQVFDQAAQDENPEQVFDAAETTKDKALADKMVKESGLSPDLVQKALNEKTEHITQEQSSVPPHKVTDVTTEEAKAVLGEEEYQKEAAMDQEGNE